MIVFVHVARYELGVLSPRGLCSGEGCNLCADRYPRAHVHVSWFRAMLWVLL